MTQDPSKQNRREHNRGQHEPTLAPGMNTHDPLEEKATDRELDSGDYTEVTRLYVDYTPED